MAEVKEAMWPKAEEYLAGMRKKALEDPRFFANQYMQEPRTEPWQKNAVKTIVGWDLATPGGDYSVRWNSETGRYESKKAGDRAWVPFG